MVLALDLQVQMLPPKAVAVISQSRRFNTPACSAEAGMALAVLFIRLE
jgi:hypothetical protein